MLASFAMMRAALIASAAFGAALAASVLPATAATAQPPGYNVPGLAQYTEMLPDAGGGQAVGSSFESHKLAPTISAKLTKAGGSAGASVSVGRRARERAGACGPPHPHLHRAWGNHGHRLARADGEPTAGLGSPLRRANSRQADRRHLCR